MNTQKTVTHSRSYSIAIAVSLGFVVFSVFFILYANGQSRTATIQYIQEAVRQSEVAIDAHIGEEFQTLATFAAVSKIGNILEYEDALGNVAKDLMDHNTYTRVGFVGVDGQAFWIDRNEKTHRGNLAEEAFVQDMLAGENAISDTRWDGKTKTYVNYYAVPVYDAAGTVLGALVAADPADELRDIVNNSLYAGQGVAHIIKDDGTFVMDSDRPGRIAGANGVFDLENPVAKEVEQDILDDMAAGRPGRLIDNFGRRNRMTAYAPLDHNNWYVFYGVMEDMVNAETNNVTSGSIVLVSVAGGIFVLFLLLIRHENNKNRKRLEHMAFVDPVTGRNNLLKVEEEANRILAKSPQGQYAVCYLDIKGFRFINELFGRKIGDLMLRYLGRILEENTGVEGVAGRVGSDKFISLRKYWDKRELEEYFIRISKLFADFPELLNQSYKLELRGGIYCMEPEDGRLTLEDMADRAFEAQKYVKQYGCGMKYMFYSNEIREKKLWETEVESKMEKALADGEFKIYLQPKVNIQEENRLSGMEALVRWASPESGLLPPSKFIEIFERDGFIVELDRYMLEEACRIYAEQNYAEACPPLILSVNVSRLSLLQSNLVETYAGIKSKYNIPDGLIELEFTEGLMFEDHRLFRTIVQDLKKKGFLCSLDDFGAGYSSLNTLKGLPVDVLKLDKAFFEYEDDSEKGRELVKNIIRMAKSLHVETVAEGIENEAEVDWLRKIGCDIVQGYVFSKPLTVEKFNHFFGGQSICAANH